MTSAGLADLAAFESAMADRTLYTPRATPTARIRGHQLPREKLYVNATGDANEVAMYTFPGFQYAAVERYREEADVSFLAPLFDAVCRM